jgi:hypothetical protein
MMSRHVAARSDAVLTWGEALTQSRKRERYSTA